jgi:hypothetical protein
MPPKELAELKTQLQELLDRVLSARVLLLGDVLLSLSRRKMVA